MTNPLTILCWKWHGWRGDTYRAEHVNALARMLRRHMSIDYRLICVTDDPVGITECHTFPLWSEPHVRVVHGRPNCYRRLRLFSSWAREWFGSRVLSIDLDVLVLADLAPLLAGDDDFRAFHGYATPLNGSLWLHRLGTRTHVWDTFDPATSPRLASDQRHANGRRWYGSDQAWMSYQLPDAPTWTEADGLHYYARLPGGELPADARAVFFTGPKKPWVHDMDSAIRDRYLEYLQ